MIQPADIVFRVDPLALLGASSKLRGGGVALVGAGVLLLAVGLLSTPFAIFAVATHRFAPGDGADVVAAALGLVVLSSPLPISIALLLLGARRLRRAASLHELSSLAHGRTHVTVLDLAGRTRRPPAEVFATLALAERHAAAARL